jgi:hypothetical protein
LTASFGPDVGMNVKKVAPSTRLGAGQSPVRAPFPGREIFKSIGHTLPRSGARGNRDGRDQDRFADL